MITTDVNITKAKRRIRKSLFIIAVLAVCWAVFGIYGYYEDRGYYASSFANSFMQAEGLLNLTSVVSFAGIFLVPIPCLIMALAGTRHIATAAASGDREARKLYRQGTAMAVLSILMMVIGTFLFFVMASQ